MNLKKMMVTAAVIIALALPAAPVFAQVTKTAASSTNTTTMGFFKTDVDNFMSYHDFSKVKFGNYFGYAGYSGNISLGYATRTGENGTFIGFLYNGYVVSQTNATRTETITPVYNTGDGKQESIETVLNFSNLEFTSSNSIAAIIGLEGMGIKFGFYEYTRNTSNPNNANTRIAKDGDKITYTNEIESYKDYSLQFVPYAGWGMTLKTDSFDFKPYIDVEFGICPDSREQVLSSYVDEYGIIAAGKTITASGREYSYLNPRVTLGAKIKKGSTQFALGYGLNMSLYNNDYDVYGIKGNIKGYASWNNGNVSETKGPVYDVLNRSATISLTEYSSSSHTISPSLNHEWSFADDVVTLGFIAQVPITLSFSSSDNSTRRLVIDETVYHFDPSQNTKSTTETLNYSSKQETSSFNILPQVSLGAIIKAIPDRLDLSTGLRISPVNFTRRSTRTTPNGYQKVSTVVTDAEGNKTTDTVTTNINNPSQSDSLSESTTWGQLSAAVAAGFTYYFTPNFTADAYFNLSTNFSLTVSQLNILLTLKK